MNFDFSEDQKMLKSQARKFLSEKCPLPVVRKVIEGNREVTKSLWKKIGDLGWCGTAIDEKYGGLGLGYLELCVLAEEMGRALAPVPFESTLYLFSEAIALAASEEQKTRLLPKVAIGELIGTLALSEGPGSVSPKTIQTTFVNGKLSGRKIAVLDGAIADMAVVLTGSTGGSNGLQLVLVDLSQKGVRRVGCETLDASHSNAQLLFENVEATALGEGGNGLDIVSAIFDRAAVLLAFEQVGGADACLAMAIDYSLKRYAFGRPIGSFQAIKHKLTDMYVGNELARSNAYYGAWALSTNAPELPLAAASARVSATQAFDYAAKENIQTHGGIGFTWESDCHFYYKRSRELGLVIGSQSVWKEKLVKELEKTQAYLSL